jgi:hypothetical protein
MYDNQDVSISFPVEWNDEIDTQAWIEEVRLLEYIYIRDHWTDFGDKTLDEEFPNI